MFVSIEGYGGLKQTDRLTKGHTDSIEFYILDYARWLQGVA